MPNRIALSLIFLFAIVAFLPAQTREPSRPVVKKCISHDTSIPLRDMVEVSITKKTWKEGIIPLRKSTPKYEDEYEKDNSLQNFFGTDAGGTIIENFDGISAGAAGSTFAPPDVSCSVGPNHVMQMVNSIYQIWDKSGNSLLGPFTLGTLWSGLPGPWSTSLNDGDPVVIYDEAANRWFASEFSLPNGGGGPEYILIAISATSDPTGTWHRYSFEFADFPDYPHYGVWPDGYYMSANRFGTTTGTYSAVFERDSMLVGAPAQMVFFSRTTSTNWSLLPSDWDGTTSPPPGAPNYFVQMHDNVRYGGVDGLDVQEFHVDWITPGNSAFGVPLFIPTSPYTEAADIPQAIAGTLLDAIPDRLMQRLQYRNFGTHQTMVVCHTIDAGGNRAGVRWYELRSSGILGWSLFQEGTYAPADGLHRWMGSIAMNGDGDISLGYTVSSSSINPEIRYTGRHDGDPPGTMTIAEGLIHAGGGSQTGGLSRWGDYSQMSIDPVDDQTFWYSHEYIPSNGSFNWKTRIASFQFGPPCTVGFPSNPDPADGATAVDINVGQISWTNGTSSTTIEVWFDGAMVYSGVPITTWSLPVLNYSTTYLWRVDGSDGICTTTGTIWTFTTMDDPSQIKVFADDFDGSLAAWNITNDGGTCDWTIFSSPFPNAYTLPPSFTGQILGADSDDCGNGTTLLSTATMNTPIDASLYQAIWIEWDNDWRILDSADEAHVEVSTDGGTTWNSVVSWVGVDKRNSHEIWDVSGIAALQSSVLFRFRVIQPGWDWWWVIDNVSVFLSDIIPVELASFSAFVNKDEVTLNWSTSTETNNQGFEIQRATLDGEYEAISFVNGKGTTAEAFRYTYVDSKVATGTYTYRLKQIDFNGSFEYSGEISVEIIKPLEFVLEQNFPNPFNPNTLIKYSIPQDGFVSLKVYNLLGETVKTIVNRVQEAGRYEINFDASGLSSGIYVYNLKSGKLNSVKKMLLMK